MYVNFLKQKHTAEYKHIGFTPFSTGKAQKILILMWMGSVDRQPSHVQERANATPLKFFSKFFKSICCWLMSPLVAVRLSLRHVLVKFYDNRFLL